MPVNTEQNRDERCIWMAAGLIKYKLCDRDFQCEQCALNRAMCGILPLSEAENQPQNALPGSAREAAVEGLVANYLKVLFRDIQLHLDVQYHRGGFWSRPGNEKRVTLGLDPLFLKLLTPVSRVILPEAGRKIREDQLIAWVQRKNATIPLYSPVSGVIAEVGSDREPGDIMELARQYQPIMTVLPDEQYGSVLSGDDPVRGLHRYANRMEKILGSLRESLRSNLTGEAGITLADGGEMESDIESSIGTERFFELIKLLMVA